MKNVTKIFSLVIFLLTYNLLAAQEHCIEIPITNGLHYDADSIALGGEVTNETTIFVTSPMFGIIAKDTMGYYVIYDTDQYGLFMGNPMIPSGFNAYKEVANIVNNTELNIQSNFITIKDEFQNHYLVFENDMINFSSGKDLFLNVPEFVDNNAAVNAGRPFGSLYYNTTNNHYTKVF